MIYVDTSVLVCALTNEVDTERSQAWLAQQDVHDLCISDWVVTEFSSALSIKLRTGQITPEHRAASLSMFTRLAAETFEVFSIERSSYRKAASFADPSGLNLRAGDALHLAICADHGAKFATLDRRLSDAAPLVGVEASLL